MARNLLRNARVFVSTLGGATPTLTETNTWEVLIQDDISFSQTTETQEITVSESGATPVRGQAVYNSALNPVDWSFSTYMRPYKIAAGAAANGGEHRCIEAILWHALVSPNTPNFASVGGNAECKATSTTSFHIDFTASNVHVLKELYIYIKLSDTVWYRINKAQVNQAEIDLSIDGIGMITWSGNGTTLEKLASAPTYTGVIDMAGPTASSTAIEADYLVTKLSTLTIEDNDNSPADPYVIPFTGGSLTINNNITYLTPNTLSLVDLPIGSFTGTRQINGSVSCYLNSDVATGSGGLLADMLAAFGNVKNSYNITLSVGHPTGTAPRIEFRIPTAQLSIPSLESADVVGLNIDFFGQASTSEIDDVNEMSIEYFASTASTDVNNDF